jgi:hypothetical protein
VWESKTLPGFKQKARLKGFRRAFYISLIQISTIINTHINRKSCKQDDVAGKRTVGRTAEISKEKRVRSQPIDNLTLALQVSQGYRGAVKRF